MEIKNKADKKESPVKKNIVKYLKEPTTNIAGIFMDFIPQKLKLKNFNIIFLLLIIAIVFYSFGIKGLWNIFWFILWTSSLSFAIIFFWKKYRKKK